MELRELIDRSWNSYERKRFIKDDTKTETDDFDPEAFKHDGFDDREAYLETYVPALAAEERIEQELNSFTPPRLNAINNSPYQALVIRYGILRQLIQQPDYNMEKSELKDAVQGWQRELIESYDEDSFPETDDLLHLAQAAVDYKNQIDDSELHMVFSYFELHNTASDSKHDYYTWLDFFQRLSALDRFPKVSRSDSPEHAHDTIEKGVWSLQEQALVYEVDDPDYDELVGIPEDYIDVIRDWLYYEMSDENYRQMLETLDVFDRQSVLVEARERFGVTGKNYGKNENRRKNIVEAGVYPSELFKEVVPKDTLKDIVDEYGLEAHKLKTEEMVAAIIEYFEQSQKSVEEGEPAVDLYVDATRTSRMALSPRSRRSFRTSSMRTTHRRNSMCSSRTRPGRYSGKRSTWRGRISSANRRAASSPMGKSNSLDSGSSGITSAAASGSAWGVTPAVRSRTTSIRKANSTTSSGFSSSRPSSPTRRRRTRYSWRCRSGRTSG